MLGRDDHERGGRLGAFRHVLRRPQQDKGARRRNSFPGLVTHITSLPFDPSCPHVSRSVGRSVCTCNTRTRQCDVKCAFSFRVDRILGMSPLYDLPFRRRSSFHPAAAPVACLAITLLILVTKNKLICLKTGPLSIHLINQILADRAGIMSFIRSLFYRPRS